MKRIFLALLIAAASPVAAQTAAAPAETAGRTEAGVSYTLPRDWTAATRGPVVTFAAPEDDLRIAVIDVGAAADAQAATARAWTLFAPEAGRTVRLATPAPARRGLGRAGLPSPMRPRPTSGGSCGAGHAQGRSLDGGDRRRRGSRPSASVRRPPRCSSRASVPPATQRESFAGKDRPSAHPGARRADARLRRGGRREARGSRRGHRADR